MLDEYLLSSGIERERGLKSYGRPNIGGPFSLTTHDGKTFSQDDLLGKWSLVYFGFTNCPDICPTELDKMTVVVNSLSKFSKFCHRRI